MFGNPEVTTGGRALKFYSSVRMDVRRVESIKQGGEVIGINTETLDGNQQGIDAAKSCWLQRAQATATSTLPPAARPASLH